MIIRKSLHESGGAEPPSPELVQGLDEFIDQLQQLGPDEKPGAAPSELREYASVLESLAKAGLDDDQDAGTPALVGRRLGDYRIVRQLGRGGMGVVFEAVQISLNRRVALKILPTASTLDPQCLARFEREAQAAASLEHPHIVRAYACGEDQGIHFLAIQYVAGQDLAEFIRERRASASSAYGSDAEFAARSTRQLSSAAYHDPPSFSELADPRRPSSTLPADQDYFREVARLGQQAAEAIHYAHQQGVIHRDLKPSNLLLDEKGNVWISDFGLAALESAHQLTTTGKVLGTFRYASPEQLRGPGHCDARSDVYSLGATLYELATLQPAFTGDHPAWLIQQVLQNEPQRPRKLIESLPQDLESVILKAMSKEPRRRYQTALELAVDLQRFLRNQPVEAKRPTRVERAGRWIQRNRLVSLLGAMTLVLTAIVIVGVAGHFRWQRQLVGQLNRSNSRLSGTLSELNQTLSQERLLRKEVEQAERLARERFHVADLTNAYRLAEAGEYEQVVERLQSLAPKVGQEDLRGFLWRHLDAVCRHEQTTFTVHDDPVLHSALGENQKLLATADESGVVALWDIENWRKLALLKFPGEVQCLAFSAEEDLLAVGGINGVVQVYGAKDRQLRHMFAAHSMTVKGLVFSADGETLVTASRDHHIAYWNTRTWDRMRRFRAHDTVQHLSTDAERRLLVSCGDDGWTRLWDFESAELVAEFHDHGKAVLTTALSRDGRLVAAGGYDLHVGLNDCRSGETLAHLPLRSYPWCLQFTPSASHLIVGNNRGEVEVFDIRNPRQPRKMEVRKLHDGQLRSLCYLAENGQLVTASSDTTVRVNRLTLGSFDRTRLVRYARAAAFAPDGESFALAHFDGRATLYDRSGETRDTITSPSRAEDPDFGYPKLAFDADSSLWTATVEGDTAFFKVRSSTGEVRQFTVPHARQLHRIWLSADARYAFATDTLKQGLFWRLPNPKPSVILSDCGQVEDVAFSHDGVQMALATNGDGALLLDLAEPGRRRTLPGGKKHFRRVNFQPSGKMLAGVEDSNAIHLWDLNSNQLVREMVRHDRITSIVLSSDGRYLVSASEELQLWHPQSGQSLIAIGPAYGGNKRYECLAISPADDCLVAVADQNGSAVLHIWDTRRRTIVADGP